MQASQRLAHRNTWLGWAIAVLVSLAWFAPSLAGDGPAPAAKDAKLPENTQTAIFAGGCFWCVEKDFDHVPGVLKTTSGYTGGKTKDPTYKAVGRGGTGHREAVEIIFDPTVTSYETLLEVFWRSVDPTDAGGQFCDRGEVYATAIFVLSKEQRDAAEQSKQVIEGSGVLPAPIVTPIEDATTFYPAEGYHQDYYQKNPGRYSFYRFSCGRDRRVATLWGDQAHQGIKK